jgi:hypothetical protein
VELTTRITNVAIESLFKRPLLLKQARYDEVAQSCWEAFSSYGLKPAQIAIRSVGPAFNHSLSFSLFSGNGIVKFTAEKLEMNFQNATGRKDYEIVSDCMAKLYEHVPLPEITDTSMNASAHATAVSLEVLQEYMVRFANPTKQIVRGGVIAHIPCKNWPKEIRMTIEHSLVFPDGIFLTWQTAISQKKVSRDVIKELGQACEEAAARLDITFRKETVP